MRDYSLLDRFIAGIDQGLRTVFHADKSATRPSPAAECQQNDDQIAAEQRLNSGRLMRINHAGEIAAQGLYQGQALTARDDPMRDKLDQAAQEEVDHLLWCEQRCEELGVTVSRLAPIWYMGSFCIGATAGIFGDRWSLGFLAETERQVVKHLDGHLSRIADNDIKSRKILEQMRIDEGEHATTAVKAGAAELPYPVKQLMQATSKIMTKTAYWI